MGSSWEWDGEVDGGFDWPEDYLQRVDTLVREGLDVRLSFAISGDFVSLNVSILQGVLLRDKSPFQLHVTLGYLGEIPDELLEQVKVRWDNVATHLSASRVGGGGSVIFGEDCPLMQCPVVSRAHALGYYRDREIHMSM